MEKRKYPTEDTTRKYRLGEQNPNTELYRIVATRSFGDVREGDTGGWIESESNLSHDGDCWVYEDARVFGNARVSGNARVYGDAVVCESARVSGNARVHGKARVYGKCWIYRNAQVFENARVYEKALVFDNARVYENADVYGNVLVFGKAQIFGWVRMCGNAQIAGDVHVDYEPVVITGIGEYPITILRDRAQIGCLQYSLSEWIDTECTRQGEEHYYAPEDIEGVREELILHRRRYNAHQ